MLEAVDEFFFGCIVSAGRCKDGAVTVGSSAPIYAANTPKKSSASFPAVVSITSRAKLRRLRC